MVTGVSRIIVDTFPEITIVSPSSNELFDTLTEIKGSWAKLGAVKKNNIITKKKTFGFTRRVNGNCIFPLLLHDLKNRKRNN